MDFAEAVPADPAGEVLGVMAEGGKQITDPLDCATSLIQRMEECLRRTVALSPVCPYCETPTYLRRHNPGCGIKKTLEACAWMEKRPGQ